MNLRDEVDKIKKEGYSEANAEAKLCQDIIIKAIAQSSLNRNVTIKGGVVMRSLSKNARRATQDLDLDFIKYSISEESIRLFIAKLNCIEGIHLRMSAPIEELKHQDYKGKRIHIEISDDAGNLLSLKMDIGVHKDLDIEQEEYCFDICFQEEAASVLINSREQMITEKLKSLMRFGTRSTRYKDVFDIYYLSDMVDMEKVWDVSVGSFRRSQDYMKKLRRSQKDSAVVQFPFVNEKGVYHYPDRLMNEMEQHVVSRLCEWMPEEKIFRWRE